MIYEAPTLLEIVVSMSDTLGTHDTPRTYMGHECPLDHYICMVGVPPWDTLGARQRDFYSL